MTNTKTPQGSLSEWIGITDGVSDFSGLKFAGEVKTAVAIDAAFFFEAIRAVHVQGRKDMLPKIVNKLVGTAFQYLLVPRKVLINPQLSSEGNLFVALICIAEKASKEDLMLDWFALEQEIVTLFPTVAEHLNHYKSADGEHSDVSG